MSKPEDIESSKRSPSFLSHTATYAISGIARRLVGFVMLPIYTRYLTPADYGVIGLLAFSMAVFEPIFGARLGRAIPKFYLETNDAHTRRAVIWGALGLTGAVSAITMFGIMGFRRSGAELLFGNQVYALALGLFAVNLLSQPIEGTGMAYIRLQGRSRLVLVLSLAKLALQLSLNLLLVVCWRGGVKGVIESGIISSSLTAVVVTVYVAMNERPAFDWQLTRRMLRFVWPLWLSGIAGLYIGSSGAMYLRVFDSLSDVGRLELGLKLAATVGFLLWAPFSQHWEPMSFRYYHAVNGERKFQVAFTALAAVMIAGGLGVSIFAEPLIRVMAAGPFQAAAGIVPMLVLGFVFNRLSAFFNFSFVVTGHTKVTALCQYATAVVITVAYLVLVPRFGLVGAAYAQLIGYATGFGIMRVISRRYYDPGYRFVPFMTFLSIATIAYVASTLASWQQGAVVDLGAKSLAWVAAATLITWIAVRSIASLDVEALADLPRPVAWVTRIAGVRAATRV